MRSSCSPERSPASQVPLLDVVVIKQVAFGMLAHAFRSYIVEVIQTSRKDSEALGCRTNDCSAHGFPPPWRCGCGVPRVLPGRNENWRGMYGWLDGGSRLRPHTTLILDMADSDRGILRTVSRPVTRRAKGCVLAEAWQSPGKILLPND
jgi:hypothetical protein